jgi:hypothetical protein
MGLRREILERGGVPPRIHCWPCLCDDCLEVECIEQRHRETQRALVRSQVIRAFLGTSLSWDKHWTRLLKWARGQNPHMGGQPWREQRKKFDPRIADVAERQRVVALEQRRGSSR